LTNFFFFFETGIVWSTQISCNFCS